MRQVAALVASCLFVSAGLAQETLVFEKGSHSIADLVRRSGKFLGRSYLLDKTQLGNVNDRALPRLDLFADIAVDKESCQEVISQLLAGLGWIATPLDRERGTWEWIWMNGPRRDEIKKRIIQATEAEILTGKAVHYVTTVVKLKHVDAQLASVNLRVLFNDPRGFTQLMPIARKNSLILTGMRPTVANILRTLHTIDQPEPAKAEKDAGKFKLTAGEHSVEKLIRDSGKFLGRCYVLDRGQCPMIENQTVELTEPLALDAHACEEIVGALVKGQGWVARPVAESRGVYEWLWLMGPRNQELKAGAVTRTPAEIMARPKLVEYVTTIVRIRGNAQVASANLRMAFTDPRGLTNLVPIGGGDSRDLLLTGFRPDVASMIEKLREIGKPVLGLYELHRTLKAIERRLKAVEKK